MIHFLRRPIAVLLSILLALSPLLPAQAAMIGNEQIINQHQQGQTRDSLQQLLQQQSATQQLQALGVSPDLVKSRIDSLTDSELARINRHVDTLDAGGSILGILLVILSIQLISLGVLAEIIVRSSGTDRTHDKFIASSKLGEDSA